MGQIAFRCEESGEQTLVFERADAISVDYAHVTSPGRPDAVNGDTVSFRQSDRHTFHAFLCDGMGSGREAAAASRLASLFLETMTDAGMKMNVLFELLNNVLLSQSGECFSTVDALEIDLLTGTCRFIKAGAAPTYIVRGSRLFKIASETPPVGILASFSAESTRFDLQSGDMILLISDGILFPSRSAPDADDTGWLAELIRADLSGDPAVIAQRIADFADRRDGVKDDRTVAVIRIKEPLAE